RAVDLDLVERERAEIAQGRIARAEIVHRNADAETAQLMQRAYGQVVRGKQHGLGDFQFETRRRQPGAVERAHDGVREGLALELNRRQIDGDLDVLRPGR